jgi:4-oxalocrotonate tautomerase
MPTIEVMMLEGRTQEQKKNVVRRITEVMVEEADAKIENVTIHIHEMPKRHVAKGGVMFSEK